MKTEELIEALVAAGAKPVTPIAHIVRGALLAGVVLAVTLFASVLHLRPDIASAVFTPAFVLKMLVAFSLAVTGAVLLFEVARPLHASKKKWLLAIAPTLLAAGVAAELVAMPGESWGPRWLGRNAGHCVLIIPLLAFAPTALALLALRRGAPARPAFAGAVAGFFSGGVAATLYGLTCTDDSPLFVASWYSIAVLLVAAVSALTARRVLRW